MLAGPCEELLGSLKRLYTNPEFSDLSINSTCKNYPVHKAVVCSRSHYIAEQCRNAILTAAQAGTVDVKDDDPEAVHLVIEYLYNLDYSDNPPDEVKQASGHTNGDVPTDEDELTAESPVLVANGFHGAEGQLPTKEPNGTASKDSTSAGLASPKTEAAPSIADSIEDFLPIPKLPKKKKKKTTKKDKPADGSTDLPTPTPTPAVPEVDPISEASKPATAVVEGNPSVNADAEVDVDADTPPAPEPRASPPPQPAQQQQQQQQTKLATHAKVYSLSAKYGIAELQALALGKFEKQARTGWDAADFTRAARAVYTSPLVGAGGSHARMRDAVTAILHAHKELWVQGDMQEIMRGELALDLIKRISEVGN
ncbi:hypothetical protein B0T22DRAFT_161362 [Podospora appendiculata]|uniref:BTB domain-containing protein n=1 Tax=Podospora appendiculata TaxID=314037 RepID=A0AAE1CCU2_9PEZI|nr:hypothetical protein B0T22DRAFT_161362 [Podospora appendiculata]